MTYTFRIAGMRYKVCLLKNGHEVIKTFIELHPEQNWPCSVYAFFQPSDNWPSNGGGAFIGTIYLSIKGIRLEMVAHEAVHLAHELCLCKRGAHDEETIAYYTGKIVHAVMMKLWSNPSIREI